MPGIEPGVGYENKNGQIPNLRGIYSLMKKAGYYARNNISSGSLDSA